MKIFTRSQLKCFQSLKEMFDRSVFLLIASAISAADNYYLVLLHQNDIHSHYGSVDDWGRSCRGIEGSPGDSCHGGFAKAVAYTKKVKRDRFSPNVVVVNSGDFFAGGLMHLVFEWRVAGAMVQHMPYDALTLGNKEFNEGIDGLLPFMRAIGPNVFVCTNIDLRGANKTLQTELKKLCPRHKIVTYGGKKIGFLGYILHDVPHISNTGDVKFRDEISALTREVAILRRKGVTIMIALGHAGYERDLEIARRVPSLDIIVGGHSHSTLWPNLYTDHQAGVPPGFISNSAAHGPYPTVVVQAKGRRVLVLQSFMSGKFLGNINITFDKNGEVKSWWPQPVLLTKDMPEDNATISSLHTFKHGVQNHTLYVIGKSYVLISGDPRECFEYECSMGNFLADAFVFAIRRATADEYTSLTTIAFVESGQIAGTIQMGNLTLSGLDSVVPYRNNIQVFVLSGATVLSALENSVSLHKTNEYNGPDMAPLDGRFLQVAGVQVLYDVSQPVGSRVISAKVLCSDCRVPYFRPVNTLLNYNVIMTEYLGSGPYGFTMFKDAIYTFKYDVLDLQAVFHYTRQIKQLHTGTTGRTRFVTPDKQFRNVSSGNDRREHCETSLAILVIILYLVRSSTYFAFVLG